jgi:nicotinamide-nucleotide amidase
LLERNLKQAEVPDSCTVIRNERGTAPGMWFEKDGKIYLSMPGVPYEMQGIMEKALPLLQARFTMPFIDHRTLMVANIGESFLAERIREWEAALPDFIKLAYLPNYNFLRLRLTGSGALQDKVTAELDRQFQLLQSFITQEELVATTDTTIEKLVGSLLKANRQTVCTAESCTGGYIAHLLTANPGSSAYFTGSVVSYDNRIKLEILQVDPAIPQTVGVVSRECVEQMVTGALRLLKTDYAVAVSGIMGPDGGTPEKPVGTVWIAVGNAHKTIVRQFNLRYDRKKNTELTAMQALNLLRLFILETSPATNNL